MIFPWDTIIDQYLNYLIWSFRTRGWYVSSLFLIWIFTDISFFLEDLIIINLVFAVFIDSLLTSHHSLTFSSLEFTRALRVCSGTRKSTTFPETEQTTDTFSFNFFFLERTYQLVNIWETYWDTTKIKCLPVSSGMHINKSNTHTHTLRT